jgi:hypothetical protein
MHLSSGNKDPDDIATLMELARVLRPKYCYGRILIMDCMKL